MFDLKDENLSDTSNVWCKLVWVRIQLSAELFTSSLYFFLSLRVSLIRSLKEVQLYICNVKSYH